MPEKERSKVMSDIVPKQINLEIKEKETTSYVIQEGYNITKGTTYISVPDFLWTITILVGIFTGLLGVIWAVLRSQIKESSTSDGDIYTKIDEEAERNKKSINRLDDRFEIQRTEIKKDIQIVDDRVWDISRDKKK
jgi:hypothetical protein